MSGYEVRTTLLVAVDVEVYVDAENEEKAKLAAERLLPLNLRITRGWEAEVKLTAPKGVLAATKEVIGIEVASENTRVRPRV